MEQIDALRTLEVCSSIYIVAENYEETGDPLFCVSESAENVAASETRSLMSSAQFYPWQDGCRTMLTGRLQIFTPQDIWDIIQNKCANRKAVRKYVECLQYWSSEAP